MTTANTENPMTMVVRLRMMAFSTSFPFLYVQNAP